MRKSSQGREEGSTSDSYKASDFTIKDGVLELGKDTEIEPGAFEKNWNPEANIIDAFGIVTIGEIKFHLYEQSIYVDRESGSPDIAPLSLSS